MDIWEVVFASIIGNTIVISVLGYLGNALIGNLLQKDLSEFNSKLQKDVDLFKQQLEAKANLELEKYKHNLQQDQLRLQISYGGIFEKQANAILDIYKALKDLECSAIVFINSDSNKADESEQLFFQSWAVTKESYSNNRILLPEQLDTLLNKFILDYFMSTHHYTSAKDDLINLSNVQGVSVEELDLIREQRDKAKKIINFEIPKLKEDLVSYMRKTLGIIQF